MAKYLQAMMEDGSLLALEVDSVGEAGSRKSVYGGFVEEANFNLARNLDALVPSLAAIYKTLSRLEPSELEVTFGMKASMDTNGLVITQGQEGAHFSVRARWTVKE